MILDRRNLNRMPFFGYSGGEALTDKLLVLINEDTGIVEDYIFRKQK
jgi:hypothetical protein